MGTSFRSVVARLGLAIVTSTSHAGTILQPADASTSISSLSPVDNLRNQSGLSAGYTSLVDDFDSYLGSNPTHDHGFGANVWGANADIRSGNIDFDLGGTFVIASLALWNAADDPSAIRQFNLFVDDDAAFSSAISLGTFEASNTLGVNPDTAAEVFRFDPTAATFVRLEILNSHSDTSSSLVSGEVAFEVVPEPSTLALAILGLLGLAFWGWRWRR